MSLSHSDTRISILLDWLNNSFHLKLIDIETASSDASFRRYFRIHHAEGTHIVMDAPPDKETILPFIRIAKLFKSANIQVPEIYYQNIKDGFLILEDFGSFCLQDCLNQNNVEQLYAEALDQLFKIQTQIDINQCGLAIYDAILLKKELGIFDEWFLENLLQITFPDPLKQHLENILINSALEQPKVCVHRDFHSRNLMLMDNKRIGIIDFQDAVIGPICYDLISLLRDCYIKWPNELVDNWAKLYFSRLLSAKLLQTDYPQFKRWFDLMGMQRHLKAIGIFARLHLRDGKSTYLADIPRTLAYISDVCKIYPDLAEFNLFFENQVLKTYKCAL